MSSHYCGEQEFSSRVICFREKVFYILGSNRLAYVCWFINLLKEINLYLKLTVFAPQVTGLIVVVTACKGFDNEL